MISDMNHGKNDEEIKFLSEIFELKDENIDISMYFLSLTDNAFNSGLLTEKDIENINSQILDIASDNVWMYTNGTSASVTSKEANELMLSILYGLDCFCISETGLTRNLGIQDEKKLNDIVKKFKEKAAIKDCYNKGLEFIDKAVEDVEKLALELGTHNKIYTKCELYRETILNTIQFHRTYNKYFSAHRIDVTIDYPLALPVTKLRNGVLYMKKYLEYLILENQFHAKCADAFGKDEVENIIKIHLRNEHTEEEDFMGNFFGLVFKNVFFALLEFLTFPEKPLKLTLQQNEFEKMANHLYRLHDKNDSNLLKLINKAMLNLYVKLKITGESYGDLKNYVAEYMHIFARILMRSIKSRGLESLITFERYQEVIKNEIKSYSMTDTEFYSLYQRLFNCADAEKKAGIIIESVSSATDLLDVLTAQCIFGKEYLALYERLSDESLETIAFLVKTVLNGPAFYDFDIQDMISFEKNMDKIEKIDDEWQRYLAKFISALSEKKKKAIVGMIHNFK